MKLSRQYLLMLGITFALLPLTANANSQDVDCGTISDQFCNTLWNGKHNGSMEVFDGKVLLGNSPKTDTSYVSLIDYRALADSLPRLPDDIRARATPILHDLSLALADEAKPGKWNARQRHAWEDRINEDSKKFDDLVDDVVFERELKKYPRLTDVKEDDRTVKQKTLFLNIERDLKNEIMDAKYLNHPNWLRVKDLFEEIRSKLLAQVENLPVGQEQKTFMLNQLRTVQLSLPYPDPRRTGADEACSTLTVNAYYDASRHIFMVCAGWFNANQSKSSLYQVISHEMSHSIDSSAHANYFRRTKSPVAIAINKLAGAKKPQVYACSDWQALKLKLSDRAPRMPKNLNSLEKLYRCLVPKKLEPFKIQMMSEAAGESARTEVGKSADDGSFLRIGEPSYVLHGTNRPSQFFLRPNIIWESTNEFEWTPKFLRDANVDEVYTQDLICQTTTSNNGKPKSYREMNAAERATAGGRAIDNTFELVKKQSEDLFSYCGKNCDELSASGMAISPAEAFADWMAGRVISDYLNSLPSLDTQRKASAITMATFCEMPGPEHDAPLMARRQKLASLEPHPENRVRRLSIFNPRTANLLKCNVKPAEQGFGACTP